MIRDIERLFTCLLAVSDFLFFLFASCIFPSFYFFVCFYLFIFGCIGFFFFVFLLHGLSLVAASKGYSSLWCAGFSLQWFLLLWSMGSGVLGLQ